MGVNASTDVRNFINDADTEAITWGPGDLAHTYDEHVELSSAADELAALLGVTEEILSGNYVSE